MTMAAPELTRLHELHLKLRDVRDELARGPRQIKAREQIVAQARDRQSQAEEQLKQLKAAADRKSLDLKTHESKIGELQAKLNSAASNREYDIIRGQIDADRVAMSVLEDEILELLDKVDRKRTEIGQIEEEVKKAEAEKQRFAAEFESKLAGLESRAAALEEKIKASETGFKGDIAERYRRLVDAYGADAMAAVEGGVCTNCYVGLTTQTQVSLRSGKFIFCSTCGRLLYLPMAD
ncbi:MAG: zinc ribbon domain-containing protein [Maioricimonas sp. JB045]|uniref:zinc ribbon domain-containing protein n=1 Tax=Maioricimonas sp. JC845 TaxID=3232138 RepID=UPI003458D1B1